MGLFNIIYVRGVADDSETKNDTRYKDYELYHFRLIIIRDRLKEIKFSILFDMIFDGIVLLILARRIY